MSRASNDALSDLHAELANSLKASMKVLDEKGLPSSAHLSVARQFLKDNFITSDASVASSPIGKMVAAMPEFDADGNVVPIRAAGGV